MLSLLFKFGKRESPLEDSVIKIQQGDLALQNKIIKKYKPFIAKTVSSVCKRYIDERDDEFSIGLIAFNEAIEKYSKDKGSSLLSFAELIIKRRVIDYIRKESRVKTINFDSNEKSEEEHAQNQVESELSLDEYKKSIEQEHRQEEIAHYAMVLAEFGLSFSDLIENSPKHRDARQSAILVAKTLVGEEKLTRMLFEKKQLPIKQLEALVDVSRKTIERNRKYIIAIAIIFAGDYIYLKDYIKGVLNE